MVILGKYFAILNEKSFAPNCNYDHPVANAFQHRFHFKSGRSNTPLLLIDDVNLIIYSVIKRREKLARVLFLIVTLEILRETLFCQLKNEHRWLEHA